MCHSSRAQGVVTHFMASEPSSRRLRAALEKRPRLMARLMSRGKVSYMDEDVQNGTSPVLLLPSPRSSG